MLRRHLETAYRFGYARACKNAGHDSVVVQDVEGEVKAEILLDSMTIKDLCVGMRPGYELNIKDDIDE